MAAIHKPCVECGQAFEFSDSEQAFYRLHQLADPKRCYDCRQTLKRVNRPPSSECFDCNDKLVRGVLTNPKRECLSCGRRIPDDSPNQYAVIRGREA